jgi:HEAT repeat protein
MSKHIRINTMVIAGLAAMLLLVPPAVAAQSDQPLGKTLYNMGEQRDASSVEYITTCLNHPDAHIRRIAAHALGKIGNQDSVQVLLKVASDPQEKAIVRCSAVKALGRMGAVQAKSCLQGLCGHPDRMIQTAATSTLTKLQSVQ